MAAAERTLGQAELNRALLARQLLLERARTPIPKALERIGGIQAQYAPSMYVGLWSRLEGLERESLTRALERRSVVQATLMRATIHLVSRRDYWPLETAVARPRREGWLRYGSRAAETDAREMAALAQRVRTRMEGTTMSRTELKELAGDSMRTNGVGMWLDLVRVPPSGTWERRRADLFGLAEDWIGPDECELAASREHIVRSYLRGFGPATPNEIADWAGLPVRAVAEALRGLELRRFRAEDGAELVDLPRAPLPDPETPAPVRFLPTWDATLLVHARRTQILPERHRARVFSTKTPQSVATFLLDGVVAGTWHVEKGRIRVEPFGRLNRAAQRELDAEAERLRDFHA